MGLKMMIKFFSGQTFSLAGSSNFAVLGESFNWTCEMVFPSGENPISNSVKFFRNNTLCAFVGITNGVCGTQSANIRYQYACLSAKIFTLIIPAENMTEDEQGSVWRCEYVVNSSYRSPDVILDIAGKIHNGIIYTTSYTVAGAIELSYLLNMKKKI